MAEISSFEKELNESGKIIYTNVGVSMMPLLREGRDVMIIERLDEKPKRLSAVLFVRKGVSGRGRYVVHRVVKIKKNDEYFIAGDNDAFGETVRGEDILGVLTGVIRNGKPLNFKSFRYKCYIHLWCAPYRFRFFCLRVVRGTKAFFAAVRQKISGK